MKKFPKKEALRQVKPKTKAKAKGKGKAKTRTVVKGTILGNREVKVSARKAAKKEAIDATKVPAARRILRKSEAGQAFEIVYAAQRANAKPQTMQVEVVSNTSFAGAAMIKLKDGGEVLADEHQAPCLFTENKQYSVLAAKAVKPEAVTKAPKAEAAGKKT